MKLNRKMILILIVAIVTIQFMQPERNKSNYLLPTDFTYMYKVPDSVQSLLQQACYDCHSNNTIYPWYSDFQPMAWMMAGHIRNGKDKLNFSEFGSYSSRRQVSKLKGIINQIRDGEMPIMSYRMMHKSARLSQNQKALIIGWMEKRADSISINK